MHEEDVLEETTHAVEFKCVGVNKGESGRQIQKVLEELQKS